MTENFKRLVKGNALPQIIKAINYLQPAVKNQLMTEYKTNSVEALALKLQ